MKLINWECLEEMDKLIEQWIKVDSIICDLPYWVTKCSWDSVIPFDKMWKRLNKLIKPNWAIVLFGNEPFSSALRMSNIKNYKYDWIWEKERLTNIAQVKKRAWKTTENIMIFYNKQCVYNPQMIKYDWPKRTNKVKNWKMWKLTDSSEKKAIEYKDTWYRYPTQVLKFQRDILKSNLHPTQKPVALMEYLIKTYTNEWETVLDFTMWSGSTIVACQNTNRKWIWIELDEWYYKIAKERLWNQI